MKLLTTTLFLCLFVSLGFSQETYYGVRAGLNHSKHSFDPDVESDLKSRNGFVIGGFVDHNFSESLSLLAELQYSAEGSQDRSLRTDYIQIPLILRFSIGQSFKIGAGPQAGLKVWSYDDGFKNLAFSGIAGIEFMITDELFLDARFSLGLSDVLEENDFFEAKNNNIQLGFGIKL